MVAMETNTKLVSKAISFLVDSYQRVINDISNTLSDTDYESSYYDETIIKKNIKQLSEKVSQGENSGENLNNILFYESMIYSPKECEKTFKRISIKNDFSEFGFPAICYFYKNENNWAYKMAENYYRSYHMCEHPLLLIIYAKLLVGKEDYMQAKQYLLKAANISPCVLEIHKLLQEIYLRLEQPQKANIEESIVTMLKEGEQL